MRIAILGGSFNPVHNGHLALAEAVRLELGFDTILFVPTFISPFKQAQEQQSELTSNEHRVAMLSLAIADNPHFEIETCELERTGVSYTIDTLHFLMDKYAGRITGKIGLIIGSDLVAGFSAWKEADRIAHEAELIIARRPGLDDSVVEPSLGSNSHNFTSFPYLYTKISNIELDISSSMIRNALISNKSIRYLVPEAVYRYIKEHIVYG